MGTQIESLGYHSGRPRPLAPPNAGPGTVPPLAGLHRCAGFKSGPLPSLGGLGTSSICFALRIRSIVHDFPTVVMVSSSSTNSIRKPRVMSTPRWSHACETRVINSLRSCASSRWSTLSEAEAPSRTTKRVPSLLAATCGQSSIGSISSSVAAGSPFGDWSGSASRSAASSRLAAFWAFFDRGFGRGCLSRRAFGGPSL
eukprot:scaffold49492_cov72-Phaeocystis_antarctica.AAC.4